MILSKTKLRLRLNRRNRLNRRDIINTAALALAAFTLLAAPAPLPAQQPAPTATPATSSDTTAKDIISVTVEAKTDQPGKTILPGADINMAPSTTGSITDALRIKPDVQFDLASRNSMMGGDITPPKISIHGARHYENNFMINGIGNNNNINPSGYEAHPGDGATLAPASDSQSLFLNEDLIGSLTIYTSNVPAEYGAFLGGVVDATIRRPSADGLHGRVKYRHTQDAWARQHYNLAGNVDPSRSTSATRQPRFARHDFSASLEGPLTPRLGALIAYSEHRSIIPLYDTSINPSEHDTGRKNQNIMLQFATRGLESFEAAFTILAAPYEAEYFTAIRKNSDFSIKGGGYSFMLDTKNTFSFGEWKNILSFNKNEASRYGSNSDSISWTTVPDGYANWGDGVYSMEGTFGDYVQDKREYGIKSVMTLNPFAVGPLKNTIKLGGELAGVDYRRWMGGAKSYNWSTSSSIPAPDAPQLDPSASGEKENGVITGEQWLNRRAVYAPSNKKLTFTQVSFFIEDFIEIERVTLRPGLRLSHDDISGNTDLSPRFFANVDVFNNGLLNIHGGYNRYHGAQIISMALNNPEGFYVEARTRWDRPWQRITPSDMTYDWFGGLSPPYADEVTAGIRLDAVHTVVRVDAVRRAHRDQIRTKWNFSFDDDYEYENEYTNAGRTDYRGVTFAIERTLELGRAGRHALGFAATRSTTKSNSRDLYATFDESDLVAFYSPDYVIYNDSLVPADSLPANNFNSPWVLVLNDTARLLDGRLRTGNTLRYETGGPGLIEDGSEEIDGIEYLKYYDWNYNDTFLYDLSLEYDVLKTRAGTLTLRLEVLNVFDRKNLSNLTMSSTGRGVYTMGRQFYAGIEYSF
ncbi:MAG: TonB-dependent receptor plug domain-containing protein [Opitutaceae bacterium]|jgi:hypothetical protein|nr:TonB-dependent receptor plug domain-containing protein [Opitutaceae bacterium]